MTKSTSSGGFFKEIEVQKLSTRKKIQLLIIEFSIAFNKCKS